MNKGKTILAIIGGIIAGVFVAISMVNMSGAGEYFLSTDIVRRIYYINGKLEVTTRDDMKAVCIKQTKTDPTVNSLCWVDTINNKATISVYDGKTYHVWTKDDNNLISYYNKYNVSSRKW